jgi:Transposase zinc-binding domain
MAPVLEVADIFRRHGEAFRQAHAGHLGCVERRIMGAITACRTAALGGHVEQCDDCGATRIAYNSCRNRHCPKCQGLARAQWLADRQAELLPVPYFHVVFTLPAAAGEIAFQNKAVVYAILFRAAAETLTTIAADPRHLGAKLGTTMVLHTWGQTLQHSSARPLRRSRRRALTRRHPLGRLPAWLLPAGACAGEVVPPAVLAGARERLWGRQAAVLHQSRQPCRTTGVRAASR